MKAQLRSLLLMTSEEGHQSARRRPPKKSRKKQESVAPSSAVRLQKYLSECGVASRRRSEVLIERGRVKVNGAIVTELGTKIVPGVDEVRVKDRLIQPIEKGILLLHKPISVVTTMDDPHGRTTVADLISKRYQSYFPVGRLDWDSSGLVIMTNDGELAQHLTHPKFGIERTYEIAVQGSVPFEVMDKLARGIELDDGPVRAQGVILGQERNAKKEILTRIQVTMTIGRNRIVRRTFDKLGFPVVRLHRIKHGPFKLGTLKSGELRRVTEREYQTTRKRILADTNKRQGSHYDDEDE